MSLNFDHYIIEFCGVIIEMDFAFCCEIQCNIFASHTAYNHYRKTYNIRRTLVGNKIVDHSDVVGASPVGAPPTTSSFST